MFWSIAIALGIGFVIQSWLSFRQQKDFAATFVAMRRKGRVVSGKFRGALAQGAIVLFVIDDDATVVEGQVLRGVTVFSRFRPFDLHDGHDVAALDPALARERYGKSVAKAVANAADNYRVISAGGQAVEPTTAVGRLFDKLPGPGRKPKPVPEAVVSPPKKTVVRRGQPAPIGS